MKHSFLLYASILAIVGCAQQQPAPPPTATGPITPTSYAAGSAANTTTAFDGMWTGGSVRNMSAGSALPGGGEGYSTCPHYDAPLLTASHSSTCKTSGFRATLRHREHWRCGPALVRDLRAKLMPKTCSKAG
jgi:hypothetical protein